MFKFNDKNKKDNNQHNEQQEKNNAENNVKSENNFHSQKDEQKQQNNSENNQSEPNLKNNENQKKVETNLEKENHNSKFDFKKMHHEIEELKKENRIKQERIENLENQISSLNDSFKSEVIKKAQEAQNKLDQKIKEYQTKYEEEIKHNKKYALKNSAVELLDIISNFDIAVNSKAPNTEIENYLKGFQMFANMFKNFLSQNGIKEIVVNVNDDFNAEIMQAFETEKRNGISPNKVLKIVKKGYKLHDIVIVPVTVIVSQ